MTVNVITDANSGISPNSSGDLLLTGKILAPDGSGGTKEVVSDADDLATKQDVNSKITGSIVDLAIKIGTGAVVPDATLVPGLVRSVAIGANADANNSASDGNAQGVAIGADAKAKEPSTAIGSQSDADTLGVAIGYRAKTTGHGAICIGCTPGGESSYPIPTSSASRGSVAIGRSSKVGEGESGVAIGNEASVGVVQWEEYSNPGSGVPVSETSCEDGGTSHNFGIAIGSGAKHIGSSGAGVAIGKNSRVSLGGVSIGYDTKVTNNYSGKPAVNTVAIGSNSSSTNTMSVAIGSSATSSSVMSVAIGAKAVANKNLAVQIGAGTNNTEASIQFGDLMLAVGTIDGSGDNRHVDGAALVLSKIKIGNTIYTPSVDANGYLVLTPVS